MVASKLRAAATVIGGRKEAGVTSKIHKLRLRLIVKSTNTCVRAASIYIVA